MLAFRARSTGNSGRSHSPECATLQVFGTVTLTVRVLYAVGQCRAGDVSHRGRRDGRSNADRRNVRRSALDRPSRRPRCDTPPARHCPTAYSTLTVSMAAPRRRDGETRTADEATLEW